MQILILILAIFTASQTWAGQVLFDARMDFQSYSANKAVNKPAYSAFRLHRMRLDMLGQLAMDTEYRIRLDLLNNADAPTLRDKTAKFIEFAYLSRYLTDEINLVAGKYITGMGGIESSNSTADIYLRSLAGDEIGKIYYPVGIQLDNNIEKIRFRLNAANITEDVTVGTSNLTNTSFLYGGTLTAKFFDGVLSPNISYHLESLKTTTEPSVKKDKSYLAVGAKLAFSPLEFELDYLNNTYKLSHQVADDVLQTTSVLGLVRYKLMESSSLHLKYEDSSQKKATNTEDSKKLKVQGLTAAFEFKPAKDENWRAHIAATQKETKVKDTDKKTETMLYIGMRIVADILK